MLTKRIIPCLDVDNGRVVKGVSFQDLKDAGDPAELASTYNVAGGDELVFLDITASSDSRDTLVHVVKQVSEKVFIPLTVGGGIRSIDNIRNILRAGADKISINTAAVLDPTLIKESSNEFGNQCIVLAIDAKAITKESTPKLDGPLNIDPKSKWEVYTHGGRAATGIDAVKWAAYAVSIGAGEILVTSMDTDGHLKGYDLELTRAISNEVTVPIIASGGAGKLEHFKDALTIGKADAVLAASTFHYGTYSIKDVKKYLSQQGIPVRM